LRQFAGPQIKAEKMNPWTVRQEMSFNACLPMIKLNP
jgi:hypothetical protein